MYKHFVKVRICRVYILFKHTLVIVLCTAASFQYLPFSWSERERERERERVEANFFKSASEKNERNLNF